MADENSDHQNTQPEIAFHVDKLEPDELALDLQGNPLEPPRQIVQINLFERLKHPRDVTEKDLAPKRHRSPIRSALDMFTPSAARQPPEPEPATEPDPVPQPPPVVQPTAEPEPEPAEEKPAAPAADIRPAQTSFARPEAAASAPPPNPAPPTPPPPPPPAVSTPMPGAGGVIAGSSPEELARFARRRILRLATTVLVLAVLGGGGWWLAASRSDKSATPVATKETAKPTGKPAPTKAPTAKPTVRPAPVPPPKPAPKPATPSYTVLPGDTLITIGDKLRKDWRAIAAANGNIRDPNLIYPGQVLKIP